MRNIHVKLKEYLNYQEKYGTTYLDKENGYRIHYAHMNKILNINEMLDGIHTDYSFLKEKKTGDYKIIFKSKSGTEYRFDLFKDKKEDNIYHLGFSLSSIDDGEYDDLTNKNEASETFGRLSFILKDINSNIDVEWYCIGATGDKQKDNLYTYFMRYVDFWEKRETEDYDLKWALYFKI